MSRRHRLVAALVVAVSTAVVATQPAAAAAPPAAIVVLGDSAAAGDGAGDYEAGTRGEQGDWCHRSPHAYAHTTGLPVEGIDLACSGAASADVGFGATGHYTEGSQAAKLVDVAGRYRVQTVVLQVGANDDAALADTAVECIKAFLDIVEPPCRTTVGPLVAGRMAATAPKVEGAVRDVREAMRRAGYTDGGYQLVLASYAAPITEHMIDLQAVRGCPFSKADAGWGRTVLFPAMSATLRGVAQRTGARFLDLTRATEGYEACTHTPSTLEWQRRLTVDPGLLVHGGLDAAAQHLAQESFHPDALAHAEIGRCLGAFLHTGAASAACVAGSDAHDHLAIDAPPPAAA